jgi:hypothetical protein
LGDRRLSSAMAVSLWLDAVLPFQLAEQPINIAKHPDLADLVTIK